MSVVWQLRDLAALNASRFLGIGDVFALEPICCSGEDKTLASVGNPTSIPPTSSPQPRPNKIRNIRNRKASMPPEGFEPAAG